MECPQYCTVLQCLRWENALWVYDHLWDWLYRVWTTNDATIYSSLSIQFVGIFSTIRQFITPIHTHIPTNTGTSSTKPGIIAHLVCRLRSNASGSISDGIMRAFCTWSDRCVFVRVFVPDARGSLDLTDCVNCQTKHFLRRVTTRRRPGGCWVECSLSMLAVVQHAYDLLPNQQCVKFRGEHTQTTLNSRTRAESCRVQNRMCMIWWWGIFFVVLVFFFVLHNRLWKCDVWLTCFSLIFLRTIRPRVFVLELTRHIWYAHLVENYTDMLCCVIVCNNSWYSWY